MTANATAVGSAAADVLRDHLQPNSNGCSTKGAKKSSKGARWARRQHDSAQAQSGVKAVMLQHSTLRSRTPSFAFLKAFKAGTNDADVEHCGGDLINALHSVSNWQQCCAHTK